MAPFQSNGSNVIYNRIIKPFVLKHQKEIDEVVDEARSTASQVANKAMDQGILNKKNMELDWMRKI